MSFFCNICIDDSDLDLILSKLSTLKTKISDWIDYQKNQEKLGNPGFKTDIGVQVELCNILINVPAIITNPDEELINSLIADINNLRANINE